MKILYVFILVVTPFFLIGCVETTGQQAFSNLPQHQEKEANRKEVGDQIYCDLKKPPKDAYPIGDQSFFAFTYPRIIPDHFSGCRTIWDEKGRKMSVTWFKDSEPIREDLYNEDGTSVICEVKDKEYEKEGKVCANAENIKLGIKIMLPTKPDPEVPSERDPRK